MPDKVIGARLELDSSGANQSLGSVKKQLREAQAEVVTLSEKYGATSKQAFEAAKRAAELKDKIADSKALVDAFNPDKKFNAFAGALGAVTGGFAAVQGAMGLLGVESEDLQKQLLKVQSAMALSQGLNAFGDAIQSVKTFGQQLVANLGKGGLIGVAVAGVALLGAGLLGLFDSKVSASQKALKDSMKELAKGTAEATKQVYETENAFKQAEKGIISKSAALKTYNEGIGQTIGQAKTLEEAEKLTASNAPAYIKVQGLKAQANYILAQSSELAAKAALAEAEFAGVKGKGLVGSLLDKTKTGIEKQEEEIKKFDKVLDGINSKIAAASKGFKAPVEEVKKPGSKAAAKEDPKIAAEKELNAKLEKIKEENFLQAIKDETERKKRELDIEYRNQYEIIKASIGSRETKNKLLTELDKKLIAETKVIDDAALAEKIKRELAGYDQLQKVVNENNLARITAGQITNDQEIKDDYAAALKKIEALNATEKQKTELILRARIDRDQQLSLLFETSEKARIQAEYDAAVKGIAEDDKLNAVKVEAIKTRDAALVALTATLNAEKAERDYQQSLIEIAAMQLEEDAKTALILEAKTKRDTAIQNGEKAHGVAMIDITKAHEKAKTDISKAESDARLLTAQFVANQLEVIADLVGKQTAAGKVLAIASATINTYLAASKALAADYSAYGPAATFVRIATVVSTIALGLKQVSQIAKVQVPGHGGGGAVPSSPGISTANVTAPLTPQPQVQTTQLNQASLSQLSNATVRAYVVERDMTTNQERTRRLNRAARLG